MEDVQDVTSNQAGAVGTLPWARAKLLNAGVELTPPILEAMEFSSASHAGQKRASRRGAEAAPYFVHPVRVACLCYNFHEHAGIPKSAFGTSICAALLHDVVEDCAISVATIEQHFGSDVAGIVLALTKPQIRKGETAGARMRRFSEQIASGGPLAVFLKCCDLMDNIADPEASPNDLFERAIIKARTHYLPLVDRVALNIEFRSKVEHAISLAEQRFARRPQEGDGESISARLHNIIIEARMPKTEAHDLVHLLRRALGTGEIAIAQFPRTGNASLVAGSVGIPLDMGRLFKIRDVARQRDGFSQIASKLFRTSASPTRDDISYLACVDQGFDGCDTLVVVALPKDWMAPVSNGMPVEIVLRLVLGAVLRNSGELYRDLTEEALELGLELDIPSVMELGVQRGQLGQLVAWQRKCELACNIVENELRVFFHHERSKGPLWHRVRMEHRVKTCASVLRKFATNKLCQWPEFTTVEDFAGVRIVCPTGFHLDKIVSFVAGSPELRPLARPITRYDREPTRDGYRGIHAIRLVPIPGETYKVPCEIQLRTSLQDAWATLSHTVAYKRAKPTEAGQDVILRDLAKRLADCDDTVTKLITQRGV